MSTRSKAHVLLLVVCVLVVMNIYLFQFHSKGQSHTLTFAMLDIGQGDALFIESPTGTQILFDAGPPKKILGQLAKVMSPFDRHIDAIVITNPDADHIGGFHDVLKTYKVGQVFEPGTVNDSKTYQNLEAEIKQKNITSTLVKKGMRLDIGGGAFIDILFPDRDVSDWSRNDGSVMAKLTYGESSVMLTGDATTVSEKFMLYANKDEDLHSDVLKVGHHGSRSSTSYEFLKAVKPAYALISDGKDNTYGHPHQETLKALEEFSVKVFRTDTDGTIIMKSDGKNETFSFSK